MFESASRRFSSLILLSICLSAQAHSETRRALLVGINNYLTPKAGATTSWTPTALRPQKLEGVFNLLQWPNLQGSAPDVYAMRDMLVEYYGFHRPSRDLSKRADDDIQILIDGEATADRVLTTLKSHLIDKAKPGDVSVFFFAGHGSRIYNELSEKPGKLDVTIVPADYFLGVPAIRDKELARIYRQVPDGVSLTVIQDNCYSGGGARGVPSLVSRDIPDDPRKVSDPPDKGPDGKLLPYVDQMTNKSILVLAAAQPDQKAAEKSFDGDVHGVFTFNLVKILKEAPEERIDTVFRKLRSQITDLQEPVLSGQSRLDKDLLGLKAVPASSVSAVAKTPPRNRKVELAGGLGSGLRVGCELRKVWADDENHPAIRLRITATRDIDNSTGEIIGDTDPGQIHAGDSFRIYSWPPDAKPILTMYLPAKSLPRPVIEKLALEVKTAVSEAGAVWMEDTKERLPDWTMRWNGASWELYGNKPGLTPANPGATVSPADLSKFLDKARGSMFFFEAPPPEELLSQIPIGAGETAGLRVEHNNPADADYVLSGALTAKGLYYAWRRPGLSDEEINSGYDAYRQRNALSEVPWQIALPVMSTPLPLDGKTAAGLIDGAEKLARPAAWMSLVSPGSLDAPFPYKLLLKDKAGQEVKSTDLRDGSQYKLFLRATPEDIERAMKDTDEQTGPPRRYVYVGVIDSAGSGALLFPSRGQGNQGNRLPLLEKGPDGKMRLPQELALTRAEADLQIQWPFGIDHYFMLVSATALSNPEVLQFEGAYQPGIEGSRGVEDEDPLTRLLRARGNTRSAAAPPSPGNWDIQHFYIRSVPKDAAAN